MTVSEKVTGDSSLIRAMSLLQRSHESGWELNSGLYLRLLTYRMKNELQSSCTMMSAVPTNTAPSSVSTRLCLPRATLYCLPELLGVRRKLECMSRHSFMLLRIWCTIRTCAAGSYLIQWAAVRTHWSEMSVPPQVCLHSPFLLYCREIWHRHTNTISHYKFSDFANVTLSHSNVRGWFLTQGGNLTFYLPGPAVRFHVLSVDHPGHRGWEGGLATPVRCGRHKVTLSPHRHIEPTVRFCWKRSLPPATSRARTTNFIVSAQCIITRRFYTCAAATGRGEGSDIKTDRKSTPGQG